MRKVHANRLLKLAAFLRTVPRHKFDMNCWGQAGFVPDPQCPSAACAMGWATAVFPRSLKMVFRTKGWTADIVHKRSGRHDIGAAQEFFGLTDKDAFYLFGSERRLHRTPKQVALNTERFVAKRRRGSNA